MVYVTDSLEHAKVLKYDSCLKILEHLILKTIELKSAGFKFR
jgi:phosphotransferase system IIA component